VPLGKVSDAEQALKKAAANFPVEIRDRIFSNDKLSDLDRNAILELAGKAIAPFQPQPLPETSKNP
jgi:F-type H+-transporting ATPase subunit alpha